MQKHKFIVSIFLLVGSFICTSDSNDTINKDVVVHFPSRKILQERINEIGLAYFARKTDLLNKLSGPLTPYLVGVVVEEAYDDYDLLLEETESTALYILQRRSHVLKIKPLLYQALLRENPAALKVLKQVRVYKPIKKR